MSNILRGLFGKKKADTPMRDVASIAACLSTPAVQVVKTSGATLSHFGGLPDLPPAFIWPEQGVVRLSFLARLSLTEIQQVQKVDWLPSSGALLFFYDLDKQPWGFDPSDRGGAAVLHAPDLPCPSLELQNDPVHSGALPHRNVSFRRIDVFPSWERESVEAFGFSDAESDRYSELAEGVIGDEAKHQVGGFPAPVQRDEMELECQLVTNGLYCGDPRGYKDPRAAALESGAADWKLLFQMDSDDDLGVMWGDAGMIYFWIREQAAARGKFEECWLILQCY